MILRETIYFNRQPIGMIRMDSKSGEIDFSPLKGKSPLSDQSWDSVDELKLAVIKAYSYKEEGPPK